MKKIFYSIKEYLLLIFLLVVSLFLISSDSSGNAAKPKRMFFGVFAAVNSLLNSALVEPLAPADCKSTEKLAAKLNLETERLRLYGLQNAELKNMLDYKNASEFDLLTAQIIGRNISPTKADLIIDKGTDDCVKTGMSVITAKGFLGLVTETADNFSIVRTIENGKMKLTGEAERSGINGLITWNGKDLVMKNVPTNYDIKTGDRIITSPLSLRYVHRIPLGVVKNKIASVSGLFADLIIQPYNDLRTLRFCFVVLNSDTSLLDKILNLDE